MIGIIGGSGITELSGLEILNERLVQTPFGDPSGVIQMGRFMGTEVGFLSRHGHPHHIPPHEINYRGNIWGLMQCGASRILAVNAVGGISDGLEAGTIVIPDQIIDYTWGRKQTFFDQDLPMGTFSVTHIDFTEPFDPDLRTVLLEAASTAGIPLVESGTYAATQGPRLETAAEINRLERDGCSIVGMTGMPEAALAREVGIGYASIALVVNRAAGRGPGVVSMDEIGANLETGMGPVVRLLEQSIAALARGSL